MGTPENHVAAAVAMTQGFPSRSAQGGSVSGLEVGWCLLPTLTFCREPDVWLQKKVPALGWRCVTLQGALSAPGSSRRHVVPRTDGKPR